MREERAIPWREKRGGRAGASRGATPEECLAICAGRRGRSANRQHPGEYGPAERGALRDDDGRRGGSRVRFHITKSLALFPRDNAELTCGRSPQYGHDADGSRYGSREIPHARSRPSGAAFRYGADVEGDRRWTRSAMPHGAKSPTVGLAHRAEHNLRSGSRSVPVRRYRSGGRGHPCEDGRAGCGAF